MNLSYAKRSLLGLSIGDAFGESFFGETQQMLQHIYQRTIPETSWDFTDDTIMTLAVFEQLEQNQCIIQDELIQTFIHKHNLDPYRGYGATVRRILREISEEGKDWKTTANAAFEGMGSMGNGAAMRIAPLGAYYYNDWQKLKVETQKACKVTHTNLEAIVGAMAVALAAALATQIKVENKQLTPKTFLETILQELPISDTQSKIGKALTVPYSYRIDTVRSILGDGSKIMAQDTVPFALWCAAHNLNNFENALWKAVSILGDRDTICAIVGGITILSCTESSIPTLWKENVENYETSIFRNA